MGRMSELHADITEKIEDADTIDELNNLRWELIVSPLGCDPAWLSRIDERLIQLYEGEMEPGTMILGIRHLPRGNAA
jgi:hypothetical protein